MGAIMHTSFSPRLSRRGAAFVEFALVFMVFLLLLVGLLELGRGVWTYTTIAHAARQGTRFAMVRGSRNPTTQDQVRNVVRNAAIGLNKNQVQVTTNWPTGIAQGNVVVVQVRYPFNLVTGGLVVRQGTIQIGANARAVLAN